MLVSILVFNTILLLAILVVLCYTSSPRRKWRSSRQPFARSRAARLQAAASAETVEILNAHDELVGERPLNPPHPDIRAAFDTPGLKLRYKDGSTEEGKQ